MTVLFVTAGAVHFGSSRMRAYWVAPHMGADVVQFDQAARNGWPADYEAVIFQKQYNTGVARAYREAGAAIWWDMCDPSWWWEPQTTATIARNVDGVVMSNEALKDDFERWLPTTDVADPPPVYAIPDRLELSHFEEERRRKHEERETVRFVWYGMASNRISLYSAIANLERLACNGHGVELTIMDDHPDIRFDATRRFPIYHTRWRLEQEVEIIANHDIALLPPYPGPWGGVKSNNKKLTAWASGLPAWDGLDYCEGEFLVASSDTRQVQAAIGRTNVEQHYRAEQSAAEWDELLMSSSGGER